MSQEAKQEKLNIAIVLDSSSSMNCTKDAALQGYNECVDQMRKDAADADIKACLVTFDSDVYEHHWLVPAVDVPNATGKDYVCSGMTAFRDAIGYTIKKLMDTTDLDDDDSSYLVMVISDGDENSSSVVQQGALKELIDSCQEPKWKITYMGCDPSHVEEVARTTGIHLQDCAAWSNRSKGHTLGALRCASASMGRFTQNRVADDTAACAFYGSDDNGDTLGADFSDTVADDVDNDATGDKDPADLNGAPPAASQFDNDVQVGSFLRTAFDKTSGFSSKRCGGAACATMTTKKGKKVSSDDLQTYWQKHFDK
jgi:hypothetical protein